MARRSDDSLVSPSTSRVVTVRVWRDLLEAFDGRCAYCNIAGAKLGIEHVIPKSRGGTDTLDNILPACASCNCSKGDLTLTEWGLVGVWWFERKGNGNSIRNIRVRDPHDPFYKLTPSWWRHDDNNVRVRVA